MNTKASENTENYNWAILNEKSPVGQRDKNNQSSYIEHGFNEKFSEGYADRLTPEKLRIMEELNLCDENKKGEDIIRKLNNEIKL